MQTQADVANPADCFVAYESMVASARASIPTAAARAFNPHLVSLVQSLFLSSSSKTLRHVVVCGVDGNGASGRICVDLGRILSRCSGRTVCVIGANPFGSQPEELVRAANPIESFDPDQHSGTELEPNLWFATIPPPESTSRLKLSPYLERTEWITALRKRFEYLIVDAPSISTGSEALSLGQIADGLILIIDAACTRKAVAVKAKDALSAVGVRLLGSILTNRTYPIPEYLYRKL